MNFIKSSLLMKLFFVLLIFETTSKSLLAKTWQPEGGHKQISIWPNGAPDIPKNLTKPESMNVGEKLYGGKPIIGVDNVNEPTITVYTPSNNSKNTGAAVLVFPGGGYRGLAIDFEGTEVCDWLTPKGVTCILLKYRVPGSGPHWDDTCKCHKIPKVFTALQDAQRAMGYIRHNADKWNIDPKKIGVLGFSAGGHLVAAISTNYKKRIYNVIDEADKESCRPDFAIALYPGHMSVDHDKDLSKLNASLPVSGETPPTFLVHAVDDPVDPVEYSLLYFAELKKAKVPVEIHLYPEGGHAFGLRRTDKPITHWTDLAETWLASIGMLSKKSNVISKQSERENKINFEKIFKNFKATFILEDINNKKVIKFNEENLNTRMPPQSTFKIPNSLIGLETGVIADANFVIKWDGLKRWLEEWNKDLTLKEAIKFSAVPYYQELARRVGNDRMKTEIEKINYGNNDISGGIDQFWLNSSLKISIHEQFEFVKKLYFEKLAQSKLNQQIVKSIMLLEETPKYKFYGKTGSTGSNYDGTKKMGWFVGFIEKDKNVCIYALNIIGDSEDLLGPVAKKMVKEVLKEMKLI